MAQSVSTDDLARAVELRARGASWEAVAAALGRSVDWVRRWPRRHGPRWRKALEEAEAEQLRTATNESVESLRGVLRHEDSKIVSGAAVALLRHSTAQAKMPKPQKPVSATAVRMATFVEGLSDAEITQTPRSAGCSARGAGANFRRCCGWRNGCGRRGSARTRSWSSASARRRARP